MLDESNPPDKHEPTFTSERNLIDTESINNLLNSATASSIVPSKFA